MSLTSRLTLLEQRLGTFTSKKDEAQWEFNAFLCMLFKAEKIAALDYEALRLPQTLGFSPGDQHTNRLRVIADLVLDNQADARLLQLWAQFAPQQPCPLTREP